MKEPQIRRVANNAEKSQTYREWKNTRNEIVRAMLNKTL